VQFRTEVESLRQGGVEIGANLLVSDHAHVIFPYHRAEEAINEGAVGTQAIGTTGRGIGPCYADKVGRSFAVRVGELLYAEHLRSRLQAIVPHKNRLLRGLNPSFEALDVEALWREYSGHGEMLRAHVCDTSRLLLDALSQGKRVLFESAQGSLLDIDHGTFPYVTSSNSSTAGVASGSGVPARHLQRVVGVIKAYSTRVGGGPFPTELLDGPDGIGEKIRRTGNEYGTVTGRPRRCGWFDAVAVRHAAAFNGADELTLMLLDVLADLDELRVAVAYELDGERIRHFPTDAFRLERCKPIYETLPGWRQNISGARKLADLPSGARRYIDRMAELIGLPVTMVSVGPDRAQTIMVL
jgi:adenylosuccinate synthase